MSILRTFSLAIIFTLALTSCAQITYNITVTGERNTITATGAVDKATEDLLDMTGSAYGDAASNEGRSRRISTWLKTASQSSPLPW